MKLCRRIGCILLAFVIVVLQMEFMAAVRAAEDTSPQSPPSRLRLYDGSTIPIGYDQYEGYYVDMMWDNVFATEPDVTKPIIGTYTNINMQAVKRYSTPATALDTKTTVATKNVLNEASSYLRASSANVAGGLKSGTVYYFDATAYHTHRNNADNTTYNSAVSLSSNRLKVLTKIQVDAMASEDNKIKISWDDVWDVTGRINYKLYISQNASFSNTSPIYIGSDQIEPNGPVVINQADGKLEYTHTVQDAASVYYIKVVPNVSEDGFYMTNDDMVVAVSSNIIVKSTKMSSTGTGILWKLDWSAVIKPVGASDLKISYTIYKGVTGSTQLPQALGTVEDTSFIVEIPNTEQTNYYFIIANVKKSSGEDYFVYNGKTIQIRSRNITVKEQGIAAAPPAPELVDAFRRNPDDPTEEPVISYEGELKSTGATILWRIPKNGDGTEDTDTVYDIWLVTDPTLLKTDGDTGKLATDFKVSSGNYVESNLGIKYPIPRTLTPNSTYYFKIKAKKYFVDNSMTSVAYTSEAAIKVVITKAEGSSDQPEVPSRPPLKLKQVDGADVVTSSSATIQLKNQWYEKFNTGTGCWEYIRTEKTSADDVPPYDPNTTPPDNLNYRLVQYGSDVTLNVGVTEYVYGMNYNDLYSLRADKMTGIPTTLPDQYNESRDYNPDPAEVASLNPDNKKHNLDIRISNLEANKTYVIWVVAVRNGTLVSGPSDPVIATTNPDTETPLEKPTVPILRAGVQGDTYINLIWSILSGYNYNLKYGTVDNINSASGSKTITASELLYKDYYTVEGLQPNTTYYFWIQAEAVNDAGQTSQSDWSDSLPVKTLEAQPPATPTGFGIKNATDAVTKNTITFEWLIVDGVEYKLEIDTSVDYKNKREISAGAVSEYTVDNLRSNTRYYARLYAYNPNTKLYSEPTQSITVRTRRSNDDYDSDEDVDTEITGDFAVKDDVVVNGSWTVSITGVNADRLIQYMQTDNLLDYKLDLSKPPLKANKFTVKMSQKVLKGLNTLKENLILSTESAQLIIRPNVLSEVQESRIASQMSGEYNYEFTLSFLDNAYTAGAKNMSFKTGIADVRLNISDGGGTLVAVNDFNRPLKIVYFYSESNWYREGITAAYRYDSTSSSWSSLNTSAVYDPDNGKGSVLYEIVKAGSTAIADQGGNYFDDIGGHWAEEAINHVAAAHKLKSIDGRSFKPDRNITLGDGVKLILDAMDYSYGSDYMLVAQKAGILRREDTQRKESTCARETALSMAVRLYEVKSGKKAEPSLNYPDAFRDMGEVSSFLAARVRFAVENGLVVGRDSGRLSPKEAITRAEAVALIEKALALAGEID